MYSLYSHFGGREGKPQEGSHRPRSARLIVSKWQSCCWSQGCLPFRHILIHMYSQTFINLFQDKGSCQPGTEGRRIRKIEFLNHCILTMDTTVKSGWLTQLSKVSVCITSGVHMGLLFSISLPTFVVCLSDYTHLNRCEMISHCGFTGISL